MLLANHTHGVIPAQAGTQESQPLVLAALDPRLRGDDTVAKISHRHTQLAAGARVTSEAKHFQ